MEIVWIDPNDVLAQTTRELTGSVGTPRRQVSRGHRDSLLRAARQTLFNRSQHRQSSEDEEGRRGIVAQNRIEQGHLSRARQALMNTHVSNCRTGDFRVKCRRSNSPLTLDPHIFAKCFHSALSGSVPAAVLQCIFRGIGGIATSVSFRRLVSKSLVRQFMKDVEDVSSPFQFAFSSGGNRLRGARCESPH